MVLFRLGVCTDEPPSRSRPSLENDDSVLCQHKRKRRRRWPGPGGEWAARTTVGALHVSVDEDDTGTSQLLGGVSGGGVGVGIRNDEGFLSSPAKSRIHDTRPALLPRAAEGGMGTSLEATGLVGGCGSAGGLIGVGTAWDAVFASVGMEIDLECDSAGSAGSLPFHLFLFLSLLLIVADSTLLGMRGLA